jgi:GMP synthase-like glutamine amidotransferase
MSRDRSVRLLVVQNDPDKPLGRIAIALVAEGARLDVQMSTRELPTLGGYDGLVVLPGLANPDDDDPALPRARAAITEALELDAPVLGICLGGQLLAQILGGATYRSRHELGYHEVVATDAAGADLLLCDAPRRFTTFHAHTYAFRPPPSAAILLENDVCVQACRHGNTWAFQCHPEVTREWVDALGRGIRGQPSEVDPRTAAFFREARVDPNRLESDARQADDTADALAHGIARGFLECCKSADANR